MRKEVLVAIIVGVLLGSAVAFGIWRVNSYLASKQNSTSSTEQSPLQQEEKPVSTSQLIITQPEDNSVSSKNSVTIKGSAAPNSTIVIIGNSSELMTQSGSDGSFEQDIDLDGGANNITIIAYDDQGNESKQSLIVVYSTEFTDGAKQ